MNKLFYSVEQWSDGKILHILGEIYFLDSIKEDKGYREAEFTNAYLEFEDVQDSGGKFIEYIYNDGEKVYEQDITREQAETYCKNYFDGESGTKFDIYDCTQDTPCGYYWCELGKEGDNVEDFS